MPPNICELGRTVAFYTTIKISELRFVIPLQPGPNPSNTILNSLHAGNNPTDFIPRLDIVFSQFVYRFLEVPLA